MQRHNAPSSTIEDDLIAKVIQIIDRYHCDRNDGCSCYEYAAREIVKYVEATLEENQRLAH